MISVKCSKCGNFFDVKGPPVPHRARCKACGQTLRLVPKRRKGRLVARRLHGLTGRIPPTVAVIGVVVLVGLGWLGHFLWKLRQQAKSISPPVATRRADNGNGNGNGLLVRPRIRPTSRPPGKPVPWLPAEMAPEVAASVAALLAEKLPPAKELSDKEIRAAASPAVVKVRAESALTEDINEASGFVISEDGLILTCFRTVESNRWIQVLRADGTVLKLQAVVGVDPDADLVLLKIAPPAKLHRLVIADGAPPETGEKLYAIGSPPGRTYTFNAGTVHSHDELDGREGARQRVLLKAEAQGIFGSTGGPVLTVDGRVVGIQVRSMPRDGVHLALSAGEMRKFLATLAKRK